MLYKIFLGVLLSLSQIVLPVTVWADCENTNNTNDSVTLPITSPVYSTAVSIVELLPNPSGSESSDEFIELYNDSTDTIDLTDWMVSDATATDYVLSGSIGANQYLVIYREASHLALNNTGDTVELFHPDGALVDTITYTGSVDDDVSYAYTTATDWQWSITATPGRSNVITNTETAEEDEPDEDAEATEEDDTTENTNSPEEDDTIEPSHDFSDDIMLSELLPDPAGSDATDEWIELYNAGQADVNLYDWQITDASNDYTFSDVSTITTGGYIVLPVTDSGISLNNSGETISLLDPAGEVIDTVTYEAATTGESYVYLNDTWQWTTTLTPGSINVITAEADEEDDDDSADTTTVAPAVTNAGDDGDIMASAALSIAAVKQQPKGTDVVTHGIVNVTPTVFSDNYFYIQDDTTGIQIYSSDKDFPELAIGDEVQITGTVSEANGELKINIAAADDVMIQSQTNILSPVILAEYNESNLGQFVEVSGEVTEKSGNTIMFDSGWNVYIKQNTGLSTTLFSNGEHYTVRGVLTGSDDGIRVQPRLAEDIGTLTLADSTPTTSLEKYASHIVQPVQAQELTEISGSASPVTTSAWLWWYGVIAGLGVTLVVVMIGWRVPVVRQRLVSFGLERVHAWATQLDRWAGLEKNTTDLNVQNRYHESRLSRKTST
ncbi:MAG: lamin tail domain-containing protein [Candidatus Kerfeldbacteria bacterium]|nr:lamin tail domain-containing protein [Candidatus Kerfeldbacteria bacterium]